MMLAVVRVVLLLVVVVAYVHCGIVGVLYEGWHAFAVNALNQVAAKGGPQLSIDDVITSNGGYTISDIYDKYGVAPSAANFFFQSKPAAGYYCIYAKRPNETGWGVPDCANIPATTARHAKELVTAGIDFVTMDGTNIPTMNIQGDVLQLRPMEILFEQWASLQRSGAPTPKISAWACLPTGATLWQNYLDLYNNPAYANVVMKDAHTNKKVFFITENPDPSLVAQIESNGGRNDVVVQLMWALLSPAQMQAGAWTFFSPCFVNGNMGSSVVGVQCDQVVTTKAAIGARGTQMAVSPSYQLSYGSLPFIAPGKLSGLTFKTQFYNALAQQPDYLFISSYNEFIAQPQPNPFHNINIAFDMGLPNDPAATSLFVDSYGWEFSRDIEPSATYGSYIYDVMSSCVHIFKSGATSCHNATALCCQSSDFYINVHSLASTPKISFSDYILTTSQVELNALVSSGEYAEVCSAFAGSLVFPYCNGAAAQFQTGPFIIYSQQIYSNLVGLYRCLAPGARHFFSTQPKCEGDTTEALLGFISPVRGRETLRGFYRCLNHATGAHYHSLDLACPAADKDAGLLGYVR